MLSQYGSDSEEVDRIAVQGKSACLLQYKVTDALCRRFCSSVASVPRWALNKKLNLTYFSLTLLAGLLAGLGHGMPVVHTVHQWFTPRTWILSHGEIQFSVLCVWTNIYCIYIYSESSRQVLPDRVYIFSNIFKSICWTWTCDVSVMYIYIYMWQWYSALYMP